MGAFYYIEFILTLSVCLLHALFLKSGYTSILSSGIEGTLQGSQLFNHALELRVRGFSIPVALPAAYLAAVYFGSWLLPLVFKRKEAYPRLAGAMDAYNVRVSGERPSLPSLRAQRRSRQTPHPRLNPPPPSPPLPSRRCTQRRSPGS